MERKELLGLSFGRSGVAREAELADVEVVAVSHLAAAALTLLGDFFVASSEAGDSRRGEVDDLGVSLTETSSKLSSPIPSSNSSAARISASEGDAMAMLQSL